MTCVTTTPDEGQPRRMQMTEAWKRAVDHWLNENSHDRSWLAKQIGVSPSTIKRMLEEQTSSEYVKAVCVATGLAEPILELVNDWEQEVLVDMRQLTSDDLDLVRSYIRRLKRDQK